MIQKTKGIVIYHIKYGDTSLVVHIFTQCSGRKSFLIKGARSKKAKIRANLFQLLNILNIEFYQKENRNMLIIKEVSRSKVFNSFPFDPLKSTQVMFMAEVLKKCLAEGDPDIALFDFLENSMEYFDLFEEDAPNFHLAFLLKLTRYLGISPPVIDNDKFRTVDLYEEVPAGSCQSLKQPMRIEKAELFYKLLEFDFSTGSTLPLSRNMRNLLLDDILMFYTNNGFNLTNLKSLPVLKELFI